MAIGNKIGQVAIFDLRNTKNPIKKIYHHIGAIKGIHLDSDNNLYTISFDRYMNFCEQPNYQVNERYFLSQRPTKFIFENL